MVKYSYIFIPYILYYGPKKLKTFFENYFNNLQNMADNSELLCLLFSNEPELLSKYIKEKNKKENLDNLLQIQKKLKYYLNLKSRL